MIFKYRLASAGVLALSCALLWSVAGAADFSGITVNSQTYQSSPYGSYRSQRRVQVFGPASGFQYRQSQSHVVVLPYGYDHHSHYSGRYDRHGFGARVVPRAPYVSAYGYRRDSHPRGYREHGRSHALRSSFPRQNSPGQRAIEPATRAIQPAGRAIGR